MGIIKHGTGQVLRDEPISKEASIKRPLSAEEREEIAHEGQHILTRDERDED